MADIIDLNKQSLREIGGFIRGKREQFHYSQKDLGTLTGLTTNTISSIENGKGTSLENFLIICRALQIQPREVFAKDIEFAHVYDLPPEKQNQNEITSRLKHLIYETDFFENPKRVSQVLQQLHLDKSISNRFSVYLTEYCNNGVLEYSRTGKIKQYKKTYNKLK